LPVLSADEIERISQAILEAAGATQVEARIVSRSFRNSNLAGVDSHGIVILPFYVEAVQKGAVKVGAKPCIVQESASTALLDGRWAFGQIVGLEAMSLAIEKARRCGIGSVAAFNSNHLGRLAEYSMLALKHDMIGVVTANAPPRVAPHSGAGRILGTNPLSYAIPAGKELPIVLDISTSVVAEGKVRLKRLRHERVPLGWIIDNKGNPTTDPDAFQEGGALLPFGGYKGYGIGLLVEILSGGLSGAGMSANLVGANGVFTVAIDLEKFGSVAEFKSRIDKLIRRIKSCPVAPSEREILLPGELEFREEQKRLREGIPIDDGVWIQISSLAATLGVDLQDILLRKIM
jgi:uncharacterized oxidoreductase